MGDVPLEEPDAGIKAKSVFCFVIAPEMKRKGIATMLLERACEDALQDGFDIIEAYPHIKHSYPSSDFGGYSQMYEKNGFHVSLKTKKTQVMRKVLK